MVGYIGVFVVILSVIFSIEEFIRLNRFSAYIEKRIDDIFNPSHEDYGLNILIYSSYDNLRFGRFWNWDFEGMIVYGERRNFI